MIWLSLVLFVMALCQLVVGALAWSSRLPGNGVVGLRIPEVRQSKKMWDLAHRVAGPLWTAGGVALLFAAALVNLGGLWMYVLAIVAVLGWLVLVGMGAGMAANTAALVDASEKQVDGCCSSGGEGAAPAAEAGCCDDQPGEEDPSKDCGVSGGCGSCALNGSCEGGGEAFNANAGVDVAALRAAAEESDKS